MSEENQKLRFEKQIDILKSVLSNKPDSSKNIINKIFEFYKDTNVRYNSTGRQMSIGFAREAKAIFEASLDIFGLENIDDLFSFISGVIRIYHEMMTHDEKPKGLDTKEITDFMKMFSEHEIAPILEFEDQRQLRFIDRISSRGVEIELDSGRPMQFYQIELITSDNIENYESLNLELSKYEIQYFIKYLKKTIGD